MEAAGLVIGAAALAGLYTACIDAIERIESYRHFGSDKEHLISRLDANKDIFQKWAKRVGISMDGLLEPHDMRLDDSNTAKAVSQILTGIRDLSGNSDQAINRQYQNQNQNTLSAPKRLCEPNLEIETQAPSRRRDKWAWTLHGKSKLESQVFKFTVLVETLDRLVPPYGKSDSKDLNHQLYLTDLKDLSLLLADHDIIRRQKDQDRKNVLAWLNAVPPNGRYEACRAQRTPNTCSWIFDNQIYQEWISPSFPGDTAKLLWLHGPAGFGKSYLCAAIVESLERKKGLRINHYFCASTSVNQDNSSAILRAWIEQLITQDDDLLDLAYEETRRFPSQASNPSLWKLFKRLIDNTSNCIFVVDGLDECETSSSIRKEETHEDRLSFLKQLQQNTENTDCRVLIVSRNEPDIHSQLSRCGPRISKSAFYEYEILKSDVGADVLALSRSLVNEKLHNKSDADQNEIAEQMAVKSEGMFLWVELQGRQLSGGKSKRMLQQIVKAMPKELEFVYRKSWETILNRPGNEKSRALNILRWAMFAARPLTVSEITEALIIPDHEEDEGLLLDEIPDGYDREYLYDRIVGLCASLVETRPSSSEEELRSWTIHLRHFSIKEFLLSTDACDILSDLVSVPTFDQVIQNNYLATICLRYLQSEWNTEAVTELLQSRAFYDYAAQFWSRHISTTGNRYLTLINSVNEFLEPKNTFWDPWRLHFETVWQQQHSSEIELANCTANHLYYAAWFGLKDTVDHLHQKYTEMLNTPGGMYGTPLQAACYAGHSTLAIYLIDIGADVNISAGHFGTALGAAARNGDLKVCRHLLDNNARVDLTDQGNRTPVYFASWNGHLEVVKILLARGADLAIVNSYGRTSLHVASDSGHLEVVRLLLDRDADISTADIDGWTPSNSACDNGHLEVVKLLLDRGADLSVTSKNGWTPLNLACNSGHLQVVKLLLDRDADLSIASDNGWTPLNSACDSGHLQVVELLLNRGADLSIANKGGYTPLNSACNSGHPEVVTLLLDRGADLLTTDNNRCTPLFAACSRGHLEVVKLLLDRDADLSTTNNNRCTPLLAACSGGHLEVVKILLNRGADLSITRNCGCTSLTLACFGGHLEVVKLLLDRDADLSVVDNDGWTPLNSACENGHLQIVKLLLDRGTDLSTANKGGWTPLNLACNSGHLQVAELLLDRGADLSIASDNGWTPLNSSCDSGHLEVVKLLLDRGADLSIANKSRWTPLNSACNSGHLQVAELLLDRDADLSIASDNGWTPLNSACDSGHLEVVKLLLDRGADLSITNKSGRTPLNSACGSGHLEVATLLLDRGADLFTTDNNRCTPLFAACNSGHLQVAELLIDRGADLSIASDNGWTPLNLACTNGHLEVVKLLLDRGADLSIANKDGYTPLNSACNSGHLQVVKLLLDRDADLSIASDNGWTPLNSACSGEHLEVVKLVLDRGADLSNARNCGCTSLNSACSRGHLEVAKLLLDRDADLSTANNNGGTPLLAACSGGHVEVVKILLDQGADLSTADNNGWTPLNSACDSGHLEVVKMLLDRDADLSTANNIGWTPLHSACSGGHLEIIRALLSNSIDLGLTTTMGETCLHLACRRDIPEIIDLLMAYRCDPLIVDDYGRSCVDWASMYQPCILAINRTTSCVVSTPKATSQNFLKRTILRLIIEALSESSESRFYELGNCLVKVGDEQNACRAFEQNITIVGNEIEHPANCDRCDTNTSIRGMDRFVCKSCVDVDLCEQCFELFREDDKPWRCKSHEFMKISRPGFVPGSEAETRSWLYSLQTQYS